VTTASVVSASGAGWKILLSIDPNQYQAFRSALTAGGTGPLALVAAGTVVLAFGSGVPALQSAIGPPLAEDQARLAAAALAVDADLPVALQAPALPEAPGARVDLDFWTAALGVRVCGAWLANAPAAGLETGVHSHGDGLVYVHPFEPDEAGDKATLGLFLERGGWKVSADRLQLWTASSTGPVTRARTVGRAGAVVGGRRRAPRRPATFLRGTAGDRAVFDAIRPAGPAPDGGVVHASSAPPRLAGPGRPASRPPSRTSIPSRPVPAPNVTRTSSGRSSSSEADDHDGTELGAGPDLLGIGQRDRVEAGGRPGADPGRRAELVTGGRSPPSASNAAKLSRLVEGPTGAACADHRLRWPSFMATVTAPIRRRTIAAARRTRCTRHPRSSTAPGLLDPARRLHSGCRRHEHRRASA
jgi:hypothetical protein